MIISHCHLYPGGRGEEFQDEYGIPGTSSHLAGFMKSVGFSRAVGLAPHESPPDPKELARIDSGQDNLDWLLAHPEVGFGPDSPIIPGATLKPQDPRSLARLRAAHARGVRFLKFHAIVMRCDPLDAQSRRFFDLAQELGLAVISHTGGGFWDWPADHARVEVAHEMGKRHPKLKLILAHAGCFWGVDGFETAIRACEECPGLYLETTAELTELGAEKWSKALARLGPSRIIYGNDYPFVTTQSINEEVKLIRSIAPAAAELILGGNIQRLL
jgi:predicted TIM-barrel fold metal-dependent hydrolase